MNDKASNQPENSSKVSGIAAVGIAEYGEIDNATWNAMGQEGNSPVIPEGSEKPLELPTKRLFDGSWGQRSARERHIPQTEVDPAYTEGQLREKLREAHKEIERLKSTDKPAIDDTLKGRWIRTKDQIPGDFNLVIVCMTSGAITVGRRLRTNNWGIFTSSGIDIESQTNRVEYWQPLPASPAKP
jgi:hypothetical protein